MSIKHTIVIAGLCLGLSLGTFAQEPSAEQLGQMQSFLNIMDSYFDIMESTYDVAENEEKAAILKMAKLQEVYEQLGQKAKAAAVFREVLNNSQNRTIRNAAYAMLADNLKDTGREDEALTILREGLNENIKLAK